jgi:hypothetical protein
VSTYWDTSRSGREKPAQASCIPLGLYDVPADHKVAEKRRTLFQPKGDMKKLPVSMRWWMHAFPSMTGCRSKKQTDLNRFEKTR